MSSNKLYIIGNGFDLHHGLKSSYWDFKKYLEDKDGKLLTKLQEYFGDDALWSDFEETLSYLDTEQIVDECINYLESYGSDNFRDSDHHTYQYEVQQRINIITVELKEKFLEWILQLQTPNDIHSHLVVINPDSLFINFNYTNTLESIYKIKEDNIFYIHNKALNNDSDLILGHSRKPKSKPLVNNKNNANIDDDDYYEYGDVRIVEANQILDDYFVTTYKSTDRIINENQKFFESLNSIKEIYIYGHSLSVVDLPYFIEIIKYIDKANVKWHVSYYSKKNLLHHIEVIKDLGIDLSLVEFKKIDEIDSNQLKLEL